MKSYLKMDFYRINVNIKYFMEYRCCWCIWTFTDAVKKSGCIFAKCTLNSIVHIYALHILMP